MFKVGDLIIYGSTGVCRVDSIGPSTLEGADKTKDYYSLTPYFSGNSHIYTPCDNDKVVMRAVISKKEAKALIEEMSSIEELVIEDEKSRELTYKTVIRECDCRKIVSVIKTIYTRKQARIAEGKKITANDEKYFMMAEDRLYGELSVALGIAREKVKEYIIKHVGAMA